MTVIPAEYVDLLDRPIVVSLATLMNDGQPQVQPVWCSYDGTHILINTAKGRQKWRNMARRPQVTVLAVEPGNDNRWLEVRGRVVEETESGADQHIDALARLYMDVDTYPFRSEGEVRVIFRIVPERIATLETSMPQLTETA